MRAHVPGGATRELNRRHRLSRVKSGPPNTLPAAGKRRRRLRIGERRGRVRALLRRATPALLRARTAGDRRPVARVPLGADNCLTPGVGRRGIASIERSNAGKWDALVAREGPDPTESPQVDANAGSGLPSLCLS